MKSYTESSDSQSFVKELSILLRKIGITFYSREVTAGLTGKKWLKFLDETMDINNKKIGLRFDSPLGVVLTNAPFQRDNVAGNIIDVDRLYELSEAWIKSLPINRTLSQSKARK
jgi:hypothetical protein